jgi:hypothetical protein
MDTKIKKVGTREEVFKGLATRTAGGLFKNDIIEKQFGTRKLYISKRLSDKMRESFNTIRLNNPNHLKRLSRKIPINFNTIMGENNANTSTPVNTSVSIQSVSGSTSNSKSTSKTQKLAFKIKENAVKNVFYPELKGMNIKNLKEELEREAEEEDTGISLGNSGCANQPFVIEEMPDIDITNIM